MINFRNKFYLKKTAKTYITATNKFFTYLFKNIENQRFKAFKVRNITYKLIYRIL